MPEESTNADAMSENLDLVRSILADWERGDYFTNAGWADPDIKYTIVDGPSPGSWTGLAAMAGAWLDVLSATEAVHTEAEAYRVLDYECVLVLAHHVGRGKKSEVDARAEGANLFQVRDGRVVRLVVYFDRDRAFADLGLKDQAMSQENIEIVRCIYEQISAHQEFPREWFDPACISDFTDVAPEGSLHRGVDATNAAMAAYFGTFENFHVAVEQIVHADDELVVAAIRDGGQIRGSSKEITSRYFHAWTFRDDKVVRLSSHADKAAALKAVGLEE